MKLKFRIIFEILAANNSVYFVTIEIFVDYLRIICALFSGFFAVKIRSNIQFWMSSSGHAAVVKKICGHASEQRIPSGLVLIKRSMTIKDIAAIED